MATVDELFERAMKLSKAKRRELADRLWQSVLPEVPGEEVSEEEADAAWHDVILDRIKRYERGELEVMDAFKALEEDREWLRKKRRQKK
jgi:hypothetical protein